MIAPSLDQIDEEQRKAFEVMADARELAFGPETRLEVQKAAARTLQAREDKLSEREAVVSDFSAAILGLQGQLSEAAGHIRALIQGLVDTEEHGPETAGSEQDCPACLAIDAAQAFLNGLGNTMEGWDERYCG